MLKYNYHTHTSRCKHAKGNVKEYLDKAYELGFKEIAMTDHLPYFDNRLASSRMDFNELDDYLNEVESLKNNYPGMKVFKGFECEYFPDLYDYYVELYNKTEVLVLGQHAVYNKNHEPIMIENLPLDYVLDKYYEYIKLALDTNFFKILAHPDLFLLNRPCFDEKMKNFSRRLLDLVRSKNIIIELNSNGFYRKPLEGTLGYPNIDFWKLVKKEYDDLKIIINADAHNPEALDGPGVYDAFNLAKELNLNLIKKL